MAVVTVGHAFGLGGTVVGVLPSPLSYGLLGNESKTTKIVPSRYPVQLSFQVDRSGSLSVPGPRYHR